MARGSGNNILLFGSLAAAALFLPRVIGAYNVGANLTTRFRGVSFGKVVGSFPVYRLQMTLDMAAINPTGSTARIDFIGLQIATPEGAPFADITRVNADYRIAPRSETLIKVPFEINLTNSLLSVLFPAIIAIIQNKAAATEVGQRIKAALPSSLIMSGNIRVNGIRVPLQQTLTVLK